MIPANSLTCFKPAVLAVCAFFILVCHLHAKDWLQNRWLETRTTEFTVTEVDSERPWFPNGSFGSSHRARTFASTGQMVALRLQSSRTSAMEAKFGFVFAAA